MTTSASPALWWGPERSFKMAPTTAFALAFRPLVALRPSTVSSSLRARPRTLRCNASVRLRNNLAPPRK